MEVKEFMAIAVAFICVALLDIKGFLCAFVEEYYIPPLNSILTVASATTTLVLIPQSEHSSQVTLENGRFRHEINLSTPITILDYQLGLNFTTGIFLHCHSHLNVYIRPEFGDQLWIPPMKWFGTSYVFPPDIDVNDCPQIKSFHIFKVYDDSTINFFSEQNVSDLLQTYKWSMNGSTLHLSFTDPVLLRYNSNTSNVRIESDKPVGVIYSSIHESTDKRVVKGITCPSSRWLTWTMLPSRKHWGRHFVLIPLSEDNELTLHVTGAESGFVDVSTRTTLSRNFILPGETLRFKIKSDSIINSLKPVQILCTSIIKTNNGRLHMNMFFLPRVINITGFNGWFQTDHCDGYVCLVAVVSNSNLVPNISNAGNMTYFSYNISDVNDTIVHNVVKYRDLPTGNHTFFIENSTRILSLFLLEKHFGRFYPFVFNSDMVDDHVLEMIPNYRDIVNTSTLSYDEIRNSSFALLDTGNRTEDQYNVSDSAVSNSKNFSIFLNRTYGTDSHTQVNNISSIKRENLKYQAVQSKLFTLSNLGKKVDIVNAPGTTRPKVETVEFMVNSKNSKAKAPVNKYLIKGNLLAVIISLSAAILAVGVVISVFLLIEFASSRRQIRNTKIRPYSSIAFT
ncbi:hypothetical protein CHS0354_005074 [Potamilus streckersoni]|uniref:IgGFc-binding protein N-terminal domain-containing protein n=1 Tax=Potamilus streckersoni TaxID=2493646 RepID=A0AAE0VVQ9_9BIVA|nr:hypothetical protein CHS0354_005074 [Potamilus streckersoni]